MVRDNGGNMNKIYKNLSNEKSRKGAFTLAEALIAIAIIGIIAALTIPTLVKNYQKKVTVERLKTTYSMLYQAIKRSEVDNGPLGSWNIPTTGWNSDQQYTLGKAFANQYLLPYLQTSVSDCGLRPNKCLPEKIYDLNKTLTSISSSTNHWFVFALKNGVTVRLQQEFANLIMLDVDLNGKKAPNTYGKDIFIIMATTDNYAGNSNWIGPAPKPGLYFVGQGFDRNTIINGTVSWGRKQYGCNKTQQDGTGKFCGALIMLDGWKIADDYPW